MASRPLHFSPAALDALRRGRQIEAITHVREDNKVGLREAKEAVEAYVAGNHGTAHAMPPSTVNEAVDPLAGIDRLLQNGEILQAIKQLRGVSGLSLREAKAWVETRAQDPASQVALPPRVSHHVPTVQRDTGGDAWMWVVLALLLVALLVWWFGG